MTRPCCGCGRTFIGAAPTFNGRPGHATPPPRPGSRCCVCRVDGVYPCRCGHPAHRGGCPRCDCRTNRPDTSVGQVPAGGRPRKPAPADRRRTPDAPNQSCVR